MIDLKVCALL